MMNEKPNNIPTPADFFSWLNGMITSPMANMAAAMNPTSQPNVTDPIATWKSFMEKNGEVYSKFMQQMVGTPDFAQILGQSVNATATYRTMIKSAAKAYLEAADMPSRDDLIRLGEQMVSVDAKLDDLTDSVADGEDKLPQLIDRVVSSLESLSARLERLEKGLAGQDFTGLAARLEKIEIQLGSIEGKLDPTSKVAAPRSRAKKSSISEGETNSQELK